jgi:hypothetical protein
MSYANVNSDNKYIVVDGQTYIYTSGLYWQQQIIKQSREREKQFRQQRSKQTREKNKNKRNQDDNDPFDFK